MSGCLCACVRVCVCVCVRQGFNTRYSRPFVPPFPSFALSLRSPPPCQHGPNALDGLGGALEQACNGPPLLKPAQQHEQRRVRAQHVEEPDGKAGVEDLPGRSEACEESSSGYCGVSTPHHETDPPPFPAQRLTHPPPCPVIHTPTHLPSLRKSPTTLLTHPGHPSLSA